MTYDRAKFESTNPKEGIQHFQFNFLIFEHIVIVYIDCCVNTSTTSINCFECYVPYEKICYVYLNVSP